MPCCRGERICALFCRTTLSWTDEECSTLTQKRADFNDPMAICFLAADYSNGGCRLLKNVAKAAELYRRVAELGSIEGHHGLGFLYTKGKQVAGKVIKLATRQFELAAMGGHNPRYNMNMGIKMKKGNNERAMEHWMTSAKMGDKSSIVNFRDEYEAGLVSREEFLEVLKRFQDSVEALKSDKRGIHSEEGLGSILPVHDHKARLCPSVLVRRFRWRWGRRVYVSLFPDESGRAHLHTGRGAFRWIDVYSPE